MATFWIVFTGVYSAIFAYLLTEFFRRRCENKLRAQHREELDLLRSQYRGELELARNDRLTVVPPSVSPQYRAAFEQERLEGKVKGLSDGLNALRRRVEKLEADRKDDQRGAA